MKKGVPGSIKLGFLFGLAVLALSALLPYHNFLLLRSSEAWVDHTLTVLKTSDALRIALTDAESGQRGYLLTNNPSYLIPYDDAMKKIPALLGTLDSLTRDNPEQQKRLHKVAKLVHKKQEELQSTVDLQRRNGHNEALAIVNSNLGSGLMNDFRLLLTDFRKRKKIY